MKIGKYCEISHLLEIQLKSSTKQIKNVRSEKLSITRVRFHQSSFHQVNRHLPINSYCYSCNLSVDSGHQLFQSKILESHWCQPSHPVLAINCSVQCQVQYVTCSEDIPRFNGGHTYIYILYKHKSIYYILFLSVLNPLL